MPPKLVTALKAAAEPILSALVLAAILAAALAAAAALRPAKPVGIDWEHHRFMPREYQGPFVPEKPGPSWYVEPPSRRT